MKNNPLVIGIIGAIIGGVLVWFLLVNSSNSNVGGMMGIRQTYNQGQQNTPTAMGNLDSHFIEQMIPHHEGAIAMAKLAQQKATRPEIKTLANNVITSQSQEIVQMKKWYNDWFGVEVPENANAGIGMGRGMMRGGMMGNATDTGALQEADNFDKAFIEEMIPHHQTAIMMANMLAAGTSRPEMKKLAQDIIDAQTKEINEMRRWYQNWGY